MWAGEFGFNPDSFWRQTPRTLAAILDGQGRAFDREHEARAWLAHTTAALGRVKKFPSLRDMMKKPKKAERPVQTWEEQLAIARAWTAALAKR